LLEGLAGLNGEKIIPHSEIVNPKSRWPGLILDYFDLRFTNDDFRIKRKKRGIYKTSSPKLTLFFDFE
jgi:hypothetical protein